MPRPGSRIGLVGRVAEQAELISALEAAGAGRAGAVLVSGDAGVGKSRMVAELADGAGDEVRVLVGRCLDVGDASLPYLPFTEVLATLHEQEPDLFDRWPALRRIAPWPDVGPEAVPADRDVGRLQVFDGVLSALTALAGDRTVLLVVEDLHWADRSTRELLAFLLARLGGQRLLVVATYRSDDMHRRHPLRPVLAELVRLPAVRRLELASLTDAESHELVRRLAALAAAVAPGSAPTDVERIARRSQGNAFFAEELVAAGALGVPEGLADLLLARTERLSEASRQVLRVVSLAEQRVRHELLGAVSGLATDELEAALREAVAHHVLVPDGDGYAFRHALLREAVHDDLLPGERSRLHARFAALLAERTDEPGIAADLARHALGAHDPRQALGASVRAAAEAARRSGLAEALLHLERALELWPAVDDPEGSSGTTERELTLRAARAASATGDPERGVALSRRAVELADADGDPRIRADARRRYALRLLDAGGLFETTVAAATEGLELLAGGPPDADLAWSHAVAARSFLRGDQDDPGRRHAATALAVAGEALAAGPADESVYLDLLAVRADALITSAFFAQIDDDADRARELLAEAVPLAAKSGNQLVELRTMWNRGVSFLEDGMLRAADEEFAAGERRAAEYGIGWGGYGLDHKVGHLRVAYQRGDWGRADRIATSVGPAVSAEVAGLVSAAGLLVTVARGDLDAAEERITALTGNPVLHDQSVLLLGQAGAECALWRGDHAAAARRADAAIQGLRTEVPYHLGELVLTALAIAARAGQVADDPQRARAEADALLSSAETVAERGMPRGATIGPEGRAWLLQARAEHTRVRGEPDPDAWAAVVNEFGYGDRYRQAYARFRRAEALLATVTTDRASDPAAARRAAGAELDAAARTAAELGARPLAAVVADLAVRSGTSVVETPDTAGTGTAPAGTSRGDASRIGTVASGTAPDRVVPVGAGGGAGALTAREHSVLEQVASGLTNRRIGEALFISEKTVSVHLSRVMAKLGATGRAEAVSLAYERGLLVPGGPTGNSGSTAAPGA